MKIFVATSEGQGARESDFCYAEEGELLVLPVEGDCHVDARCGCRRSLQGLSGSTTTFMVEDREISTQEYLKHYLTVTIKCGMWTEDETKKAYLERLIVEDMDALSQQYLDEFGYDPASEVEELLQEASKFPAGTVVEKRKDEVFPRITELTYPQRIRQMIEDGESRSIEFKESLSLDVKKQTKESYIEQSSLKTIVGFLNSEGGSLLVGISDNGYISGVDKEITKIHKSADKFLLHFKNLLQSKIGESFYPFIDHRLVTVDDVKVLLIECEKSPSPCYLEGKDFYVRTNPATDKLEGPKLVEYVRHHFGPR